MAAEVVKRSNFALVNQLSVYGLWPGWRNPGDHRGSHRRRGMGLRFSNEGWNQLILRNHSIRWLIGDIKTDGRATGVLFHYMFRAIIPCIVVMSLQFLVNRHSETLTIEEKRLFSAKLDFRSGLNDKTISPGLREVFEAKGISLPQKAMIEGETPRWVVRWVMTGGAREYIIKEENKEESKDESMEQNAEESKVLGVYEDAIGFFEDFSYFALVLSCVFATMSIRHMLRRFHKAFFTPGLVKKHDFGRDQDVFEGYRSFLAMKRGSGYGKWVILPPIFTILIFSLVLVYLPLVGKGVKSWHVMPWVYPWNYISALIAAVIPFVLLLGNMIWYGIGCAVSGYKMLNRMKRNGRLEAISVSADGKGNLYILGLFSFALFLMCMSLLPYTLAWAFTFGVTSEFKIVFPIFWLFMIFPFFYPLLPAHSVMVMTKEKELKHISELFEECHKRYLALEPKFEDMDEVLATINHIENRYDRAKRTGKNAHYLLPGRF